MPSSTNFFVGPNDRRRNSGDSSNTGERGNNRRKESDVGDKTIVNIPPYAPKNVALAQDPEQLMAEPQMLEQQQNFKIRLAQSKRHFNSASMLVQRMYLQKGYDIPGMHKMPDRIALTASQKDAVVGTVTLGIDTSNGLLADENYKQEVDQLRAEGRHVYELTKFAVDQKLGSKRLLGALFHVIFIYGHVLQKQTDLVIEVTPQHAKFYKRTLGFKQMGQERLNSRVNTVGVLLRLEMDYVNHQIERWGGQADQAVGERSLYPYFFSKEDEKGITQRLLHGE